MRSLNPSTRAKAIELANSLMARGDMKRQDVIQASITEARRQARASFPDNTTGTAYTLPQAA